MDGNATVPVDNNVKSNLASAVSCVYVRCRMWPYIDARGRTAQYVAMRPRPCVDVRRRTHCEWVFTVSNDLDNLHIYMNYIYYKTTNQSLFSVLLLMTCLRLLLLDLLHLVPLDILQLPPGTLKFIIIIQYPQL